MTSFLCCGLVVLVLAAVSSHAQTYSESILYNFPLTTTGSFPHPSGLVLDSSGNLYGTTEGGGSCCGTIFRLSNRGVFTNIYSFTGLADGFSPCCLVMDKSGNLYGTTRAGGVAGWGTVFKYSTTTKKFTTLHQFGETPGDGELPAGPLTIGSDGNLYGVTVFGGSTGLHGDIFSVTPQGKETVLYDFLTQPEYFNLDNVLRNGKGDLYVLANFCCLLKITARGVETEIAEPGDASVYFADAPFARNADGNFYGEFDGNPGAIASCGLWKVNGGNFAVSYFAPFDACPGPIMFLNGKAYGPGYPGGVFGQGNVFEFDPPTGTPTTLYDFGAVPNDGNIPSIGLVVDSKGNFYGMTYIGGTNGYGTIYKLTKK
ncbi:MAG: choice-of-anchor tandem repeat GloVer-containing protein [Candidatus Sulfotelmatobacter sp.]